MSVKDILKLFLLDWVVTAVMYLVGMLVSGSGDTTWADIVFYISNLSTAPTGVNPLLDVFTYLFVSLAFVVLISFLVNKSYIKISVKSFVVAQVLYLVSVACAVLLIPVFV